MKPIKERTIKELLEIILQELKRRIKTKSYAPHSIALCHIAHDTLGRREYIRFRSFLYKTNKNRKVFFDNDNIKCSFRALYHWKVGSEKPRLNWMAKAIKAQS